MTSPARACQLLISLRWALVRASNTQAALVLRFEAETEPRLGEIRVFFDGRDPMIGGAPFLHAITADDGKILWQQPKPQATYAAAAEAGGVVFIGGNDFTFRALRAASTVA